MKILILIAGNGKRFLNEHYSTIKPLIKVKDKTILEWSTSSLPFIKHNGNCLLKKENCNLIFAIQNDHDKNFNLSNKLFQIYGNDIKIHKLDYQKSGNLETAYKTLTELKLSESEEELLVLNSGDCYNGKNFLFYKNLFKESDKKDFASICYFYPNNNKSQTFFIKINPETNKVEDFFEKDKKPKNKAFPMVGTFYFSKISLFMNAAKEILETQNKINEEFYMSQTIKTLLDKMIPVYGMLVSDVKTLNVPEDVKRFSKYL